MAERPIFVPRPRCDRLVDEIFLQLKWNPGFARLQKRRNINALHEAAAEVGYRSVLEVSTKSETALGRELSAFTLKVKSEAVGEIPLECAFQGSKAFEYGGPFTDLYVADVRSARKDERLKHSGKLIGFDFDGTRWPTEPKTAFYDWLYLSSVHPMVHLTQELLQYDGFSDIEFNPARSVNCQARAAALFSSLFQRGELEIASRSASSFLKIIRGSSYRPDLRSKRVSS